MKSEKHCPLCKRTSKVFYNFNKRLYHQCDYCSGIFVDPSLILTKENEKSRYEEHNNNVYDKRFQKFVSPITDSVKNNFSENDMGLDFGAGHAPVITKVLSDFNYNIKPYDPFYFNDKSLFQTKYDYITCCEVIEHFNDPPKEFAQLKELLNPNGKLYVMTWLYDESIDFHNWNYKDDHTHVFIYHKNSMLWIKEKFGFTNLKFNNRLITFENA